MNYSRSADDLMSKMAHNQACIFEQASLDNLPSYSFVKMYMCSKQTNKLDKLIQVSDDDIYIPIKNRVKRRGIILPSYIMHWIGYIYRCLSYLYNISSRILFKNVPLKYLVSVYPLYHSQDPVKAALWIIEERFENNDSNIEKAIKLMKQIY